VDALLATINGQADALVAPLQGTAEALDIGIEEYELHLGGDNGPVAAMQRAATDANGIGATMLRSQRPEQVGYTPLSFPQHLNA